MSYQLQRFTPTDAHIGLIKKLVKCYGTEVCRSQIEQSWIEESMSKHTFGYVSYNEKAHIGRRSLRNETDKYHVYGFITCRIHRDNPKMAIIDLVCGRKTNEIGKLLMEMVENECKDRGVQVIQLYSLQSPRLQAWYKTLGYVGESIRIWDGKPKGMLMTKLI